MDLTSLSKKIKTCFIREYTAADREACLAIRASNVPEFFSPEGAENFEEFLSVGTSYLLVVVKDSKVIACGGLVLRGEGPVAALVNGMVHRDYHGQGYGSTLLATRLSLIEVEEEPVTVFLETNSAGAPFFGQFGFGLHSVKKNLHGDGEDYGQLTLKIDQEEVTALRGWLTEKGVQIELSDPPALDGMEIPEEEWMEE